MFGSPTIPDDEREGQHGTIYFADIFRNSPFLNIILDPIFIFDLDNFGGIGFGMGIKGAALATVISQSIVFSIFIYMLFVKEHAYITF